MGHRAATDARAVLDAEKIQLVAAHHEALASLAALEKKTRAQQSTIVKLTEQGVALRTQLERLSAAATDVATGRRPAVPGGMLDKVLAEMDNLSTSVEKL